MDEADAKIEKGSLDGAWRVRMRTRTADELRDWADALESQISDPENTDDPKWLHRWADRTRHVADVKERAFEHKQQQSGEIDAMAGRISHLWLWCGLGGLALWLALLALAFTGYPSLDNLLVGWPVFFFDGVDSLGALRDKPVKFATLLLAETAIVFLLFAGVGLVIQLLAKLRRNP